MKLIEEYNNNIDKEIHTIEWHIKLLKLAKLISTFSKDPSTKVGAVIVDKNNRLVSTGYNGFARGIKDTKERLENRDFKYENVVHAEINAILFAKCDLEGHKLFTWPFGPCSRCSGPIIQSGIKTIIFPQTTNERWTKSIETSKTSFLEVGDIEYYEYKIEILAEYFQEFGKNGGQKGV